MKDSVTRLSSIVRKSCSTIVPNRERPCNTIVPNRKNCNAIVPNREKTVTRMSPIVVKFCNAIVPNRKKSVTRLSSIVPQSSSYRYGIVPTFKSIANAIEIRGWDNRTTMRVHRMTRLTIRSGVCETVLSGDRGACLDEAGHRNRVRIGQRA